MAYGKILGVTRRSWEELAIYWFCSQFLRNVLVEAVSPFVLENGLLLTPQTARISLSWLAGQCDGKKGVVPRDVVAEVLGLRLSAMSSLSADIARERALSLRIARRKHRREGAKTLVWSAQRRKWVVPFFTPEVQSKSEAFRLMRSLYEARAEERKVCGKKNKRKAPACQWSRYRLERRCCGRGDAYRSERDASAAIRAQA